MKPLLHVTEAFFIELNAIMNTADLYKYYDDSNGVSIDSRSIRQGEVFFAIKGPNFDGHKYLDAAFKNGARYAVIDDPQYLDNPNILLVQDTIQALQNLAKYHRCMLTIPVIGITGSNGKTTTKELMASVLSTKFSVFATKGNLNNHLGVPLSVLSICDKHEIAIIEMGANHIGEIKFLSEIAMPDLGLITNVGKAHLEGFGNLEGVRKGKTELFEYLDKTNGTIFLNADDQLLLKSIPETDKIIRYSKSKAQPTADYPFVEFLYNSVSIHSNLSGVYNTINIVAALTIGEYFGVDADELKRGINEYIPENNRSQIKETDKNVLIMDAYNANPSSMVESIKNFNAHPATKKTLILGHMLELGESSKVEHSNLVSFISSFDWENVFLVGSEFLDLDHLSTFNVYKDTKELSRELIELDLRDNTILLKGSRGIALEKCTEYL